MVSLEQHKHKIVPFLRLGFRPFFFAAGLVGVIFMALWLVFFHTHILNLNISVNLWHGHEMVFAYAVAVIVGFLLSAVKNWTNLQTLNGKPLLALFVLWIAGRFLPFIPLQYLAFQALIDVGFLGFAIVAIAYPIIKTKQKQQIGIIGKLLLITVAHGLFYLGLLGIVEHGEVWGLYLGFYLIISLILMMARRLIPFFIERGLHLDSGLKNSKWLDLSSLFLVLLFIPIEVFSQGVLSAILAGILFVIHSLRLFNWHHPGIWKKPLLWSIYCAYGFIILGFGLNALSYFVIFMPNIALHSFAFGIALMTLSMMSRVSLGHTGRNVFAPPRLLNRLFIILSLSFVFRVIAPIISPEYYIYWIFSSQVLWIVSFVMFLLIYTPLFFKVRIDGQFG